MVKKVTRANPYSYPVLQIYTCHFSYAALQPASLAAKMLKLDVLKMFKILYRKSYENVEGKDGAKGQPGYDNFSFGRNSFVI